MNARHLYLIAWLYANRERCDGILHMPDFRNVAAETQLSEHEAEDAGRELVQANLWRGRLPGPGYQLIGFLDWNYSAHEIDRKAELAKERMRKHRAKKGSPDPSKETDTQATQATQEQNALDNALHSDEVPNLDPYTPTPEDLERGKAAAQRLLEIKEAALNR